MLMQDIIENQFMECLERSKYDKNIDNILLKIMDGVIEIFQHLNFNMGIDENHNCKILLLFNHTNLKHFEYLVLVYNQENGDLEWDQINYDGFLKELLGLMWKVANKIKKEEFNKTLNYLTDNLINNKAVQDSIKERLECKLDNLYNTFHKLNDLNERPIYKNNESIYKQLELYKIFRSECSRFKNGFNPKINNTIVT